MTPFPLPKQILTNIKWEFSNLMPITLKLIFFEIYILTFIIMTNIFFVEKSNTSIILKSLSSDWKLYRSFSLTKLNSKSTRATCKFYYYRSYSDKLNRRSVATRIYRHWAIRSSTLLLHKENAINKNRQSSTSHMPFIEKLLGWYL